LAAAWKLMRFILPELLFLKERQKRGIRAPASGGEYSRPQSLAIERKPCRKQKSEIRIPEARIKSE
jgi:hypothetical protein